ncbi:MAG: PAC2 family protein [Candidatus Omnitrophica bacterium]|nr:PAC2 family protein [Candidatus Omnitrophota bacterium]
MDVAINLFKNPKLKSPILIQGFPGAGLVGTISSLYLVEKLKMEFVGYIYSSKFPPLAAIHNGKPYFPARVYASKKHNIYLILSEFIIPTQFIFPLAHEIYNFAKKHKVKKIISIGSIPRKEEKIDYQTIYGVVSTSKLLEELEKQNIHVIREGVTTGVSSILLSMGAMENLEVISFLSNSADNAIDLMACYNLLLKLKSYLNLEFDLNELEADAKKMEEQMKKILQKASEHQISQKDEDASSMYQ